MQISNNSVYFTIENNQLATTQDSEKKASLHELSDFFYKPNYSRTKNTDDFLKKWPSLRVKFKNKMQNTWSTSVFEALFSTQENSSFVDYKDLYAIDFHVKIESDLNNWVSNSPSEDERLKRIYAAKKIGKVAYELSIKRLDLTSFGLTTLPESIGALLHIEVIGLCHNNLATLPHSFRKLTNLKILNLADNQLTSIPDSITNLTNLKTLFLDNNQLTSIPENIVKLINLEKLGQSENQFTSISDRIGNLTNLKELWLSENQLIFIPNSITDLANLEFLRITHNQLTSLPDRIGNLKNLQSIFISNNN